MIVVWREIRGYGKRSMIFQGGEWHGTVESAEKDHILLYMGIEGGYEGETYLDADDTCLLCSYFFIA